MDVEEKTVTGMAEYIEREAAQTSFRKYSFAESYDAFAVDCILKSIHAADVAPLRHGRWVEYPRPHYFKCSECKYTVPYRKAMWCNGKREYNYCPNCGAKMDGGED